jgi:aryl-phospho-beta-D-glucosidase BglC (GH1 family)
MAGFLRGNTGITHGRARLLASGIVTLLAGLTVVVAGTTASATTTTTTTAPPGTRPGHAAPRDAMETVAAMQPGWNLGNSLDATGDDETSWGNPRVTEELLDNVRAQGFNSIRIPVTWGQHQGPGPDYTIDTEYLDRVGEIVDWALDDGFYVLLNIHHDSWQWISDMPADRGGVLARYNAIWTQLADAFRDSSSRLLFESVNEPQFNGSSGDAENAELLDELNTSFHHIVRRSGGDNADRLLVLPTLHTSADQVHVDELLATFDALDDPRLVATVHFYGYWPFSVNVAGGTRFDATVQQDLTDAFDRVHHSFVDRDIPVILGEYGLLGFDRHTGTVQQGEKLKFFEFLGHYARRTNITTMLWDNGQHFQRTGFRWNDPELFAQIRSSWTTRSGTASSDQVFSARSAAPTDQTLTLNSNGTRFVGLRHGTTNLVRGRDYTVRGDQLTIKAATIARLSGSREYGTNAVLSARFARGVPWRISLVTHDEPVLRDATGTTSSFAIPTAFRGDQLATMEATYADGSNAGPHNWTSYKEFDRAFAPDYAADVTTLTSDFFAEVRDGDRVTLTFHYWSGATATYYVTKSGTSVTGSMA